MSNCKVLSVVSQKGGVGKTNICTNLGVGLAQTGQKVLIIDVDSQASQTISLPIFVNLKNDCILPLFCLPNAKVMLK